MPTKASLMLALMLALQACKQGPEVGTLPVIGLEQNGKATITHLSSNKLLKKVGPTLESMSELTLNKLERAQSMNDWNIKRISVGLQLVGEVEFTEKFKLEAEPSIELRFERLGE